MNRGKIFNDPVYGFVIIPFRIIFDIIEHPYFQRLRRIKQLGLSNYVYPGAIHTRFQHALGAMHLMNRAIRVLQSKGYHITEEEHRAAALAIILHDIGHGPYSHALEQTIVPGINHEKLSILFMEAFNQLYPGELSMCLEIFKGTYPKKFLCQLVSSQLDVDRLDYLARDTYFTGVHEGMISYNRIIDMMDVHENELVIEAKGIYSIEKFIVARRLMYWQVYLHKTVLCAEQILIKALQRAKQLAAGGTELFATPALRYFLYRQYEEHEFSDNPELLENFARLDDCDILTSLKVWQYHDDRVLSILCDCIANRHLFRIKMQNKAFDGDFIEEKSQQVAQKYGLAADELPYIFFHDTTSNSAYHKDFQNIIIKYKDGSLQDVASASDQLNIAVLSQTVIKHYICYPKDTE